MSTIEAVALCSSVKFAIGAVTINFLRFGSFINGSEPRQYERLCSERELQLITSVIFTSKQDDSLLGMS